MLLLMRRYGIYNARIILERIPLKLLRNLLSLMVVILVSTSKVVEPTVMDAMLGLKSKALSIFHQEFGST